MEELKTVTAPISRRKLIWLVIIDLVIVLAALHVQGIIFGFWGEPIIWPLVLVRAFLSILPSFYDLDIEPVYAAVRGLAVIWLWLSFFRSITSTILIIRKRIPLFAEFAGQLLFIDAVAAVLAVPLYMSKTM